MRVVHQGQNDQLAMALERAFAMAETASPNALAAKGPGLIEALLMSGSQRPLPRPHQEVANALAGRQPQPQQQAPGVAAGSTPTLQGLLSARYMQPPPSAAAPSPAMRQSPAPQQASWQAAPVIEPVRQQATRTQQAGGAARPIEVELPDGTVVEFPAGTSDSVMRDALQREFGHGLAGGASKASFADLMKATRRAHEAGDGEAARRLAGLAVKARDREQAQVVDDARQRRAEASSAGATNSATPQRQSTPEEILAKSRELHAAGDIDGAKRLAQIAIQRRNAAQGQSSGASMEKFEVQGADGQIYDIEAPDEQSAVSAYQKMAGQGAGPWTKYQAQPASQNSAQEDGPWTEWQNAPLAQADQSDDSWWRNAPLVQDTPPQIVGGVIMPPGVPASGQWDAQPAQMGAKDYIRQGSDVAADALAAGAAGVSRGVTGLADLPGVVTGGAGKLATSALERTGVVSPGMAQGMRDSFDMMPGGSGDLFRGTASAATGGASEFRGNTILGNYAGTAGEFIPPALAMGGAPVANALRYGLLPAFASETAGQMTKGTAVEPWARAGAAMLAAPAANLAEYGIRRAISPHGGGDQGRLALARVLDDAGVPISAGQRVGNEALRRKEGMTNAGQALNETQREALTRAALRTTGTDASRATPEVLAETARRIGSVFDDVARGVDVTPEPATLNALAAANETYKQLAPKSAQAPIIGEIVKRMTGAFRTGQTIPASTVNSWRSNLSKLTTSSDGASRSAAVEALNALDDSLTSTLTNMGRADDVARLATARTQWRNFLAIQKAATGAGEGAAAGILSPSALRSAVVQQGRSAYAQGTRGELGDLARAAEGVIKPLPTSGTAENLRALGIPSAMWSAGGATAGYKLAGPTGGLLGAMAASAVPSAAGAARMSRPVQNWLANQAVGPGADILPRNTFSPILAALLGFKGAQ